MKDQKFIFFYQEAQNSVINIEYYESFSRSRT